MNANTRNSVGRSLVAVIGGGCDDPAFLTNTPCWSGTPGGATRSGLPGLRSHWDSLAVTFRAGRQ